MARGQSKGSKVLSLGNWWPVMSFTGTGKPKRATVG